MRINLLSAISVLFACVCAAALGFVAACAVGALGSSPGGPVHLVEAFCRYLFLGALPCCLVGTPLALACWALIPWVHRLGQWVRSMLAIRRVSATDNPCSPAASIHAGNTSTTPGMGAGVWTGMLLSFLNFPAYLAAGAVGQTALVLAFLSAGAVAGGVLGWCRATRGQPCQLPRWPSSPAFLP